MGVGCRMCGVLRPLLSLAHSRAKMHPLWLLSDLFIILGFLLLQNDQPRTSKGAGGACCRLEVPSLDSLLRFGRCGIGKGVDTICFMNILCFREKEAENTLSGETIISVK